MIKKEQESRYTRMIGVGVSMSGAVLALAFFLTLWVTASDMGRELVRKALRGEGLHILLYIPLALTLSFLSPLLVPSSWQHSATCLRWGMLFWLFPFDQLGEVCSFSTMISYLRSFSLDLSCHCKYESPSDPLRSLHS